jgi:VCBS repeat-containing protein
MARSITFTIGHEIDTQLKITEGTDGTLLFEIDVLDSGRTGDLRGLFFDLKGLSADEHLSVRPAADLRGHITGSKFGEGSVSAVAGDANLNGSVIKNLGKFDVGIAFGTPGIGRDDIQSTAFVLDHSKIDLSLDMLDLADFGLRYTSVGKKGGKRSEGVKIGGVSSGVAVGDVLVVEENGSAELNLLDNDSRSGSLSLVNVADAAGNAFTRTIDGFETTVVHEGRVLGSLVVGEDGDAVFIGNGADVGSLSAGEQVRVSFSYTSTAKGNGSFASADVNVTITGTNDAPVGLPDTAFVIEGDRSASSSPGVGNVLDNDTDLDTAAANFSVTNAGVFVGAYGTLTISADGSYSYQLDDSNADVDALTAGETLTDIFTYTMSDNDALDPKVSSSTLAITIAGVDDAPAEPVVLYTSEDGQVLSGRSGNDRLTSHHNHTLLYGEDGDDRLYTTLPYGQLLAGEEVAVSQYAGGGNDRLRVVATSSMGHIGVAADGGDGEDLVEVDSRIAALSADTSASIENSLVGGSGNDVLQSLASINGTHGVARNEVYGGAGSDTIILQALAWGGDEASEIANFVDGGDDDDLIRAHAAVSSGAGHSVSNELYGGSGADTLTGYITNLDVGDLPDDLRTNRNILGGGVGDDWLAAYFDGSGPTNHIYSLLLGEDGNDTLIAESRLLKTSGFWDEGEDRFGQFNFGGTAIHQLRGNEGSDHLISRIDATGGHYGLFVNLSGENGNDVLHSAVSFNGSRLGSFDSVLSGGEGSDQLISNINLVAETLPIRTTFFSTNRLMGGDQADYLEAIFAISVTGWLEDYLVGGNELRGGSGNDTLIGRLEVDIPDYSAALEEWRNVLYGDEGDDILIVHGGGYAASYVGNFLDGGNGDDLLTGSEGRDRLIGSAGDDEMTGNGGNDVFLFGLGSGQDIITDYELGQDSLLFEGGQSISSLIAQGLDTLVILTDGSTVLLQSVMLSDTALLIA